MRTAKLRLRCGMAKPPKDKTPSPEAALRDAFRAVEAQPVPKALGEHLDRLTGQPPRKRH